MLFDPIARSRIAARIAVTVLAAWMLLESWGIMPAIAQRRDGGWLAAGTALAILLSALVSSIAGFAFCAVAGSALAYLKVDPVHAVQMMVVCSIATQFYAVWTIRDSIQWRPLRPMIAAGAATIPLGVWLLLHADALLYASGLGIFLIGYGAYVAFRRHRSSSTAARGTTPRSARWVVWQADWRDCRVRS
ncbi:MAG TPA: sulfite exporter TauE/SafE family protein [Casimicrobiaceae bacterium]|nr:sulfite exporter TauE/SafE family protein [Casimicrobiaceae bacterium]